MITADEIKAKYWALEILSSNNQNDMNNISGSLGTSKIDFNPHQIEAALFALKSPISQGVILADEVGLGKTIEAGIVIAECFSRGQTSILVVAPASLCQQWQTEMQEKFDLPAQVIDSKIYKDNLKNENDNLFLFKGITICSYNCAVQLRSIIKHYNWDLVVIDEAHKLRNFYKGKTKIADGINEAFSGKKKLLLTATSIKYFEGVKPSTFCKPIATPQFSAFFSLSGSPCFLYSSKSLIYTPKSISCSNFNNIIK